MNNLNYKHIMIVDLEATCCNRKSIPRHEMEIIEIGAVMVSRRNLQQISEFQTFVNPVRHPQLTGFCNELTSITQSDVNSAPGFSEALDAFYDWLNGYEDYVFCSWGGYDKNQFLQDCQYHGIEFPVKAKHVNIKKLFSENLNLRRNYGMAGALRYAGISLEGTHHRGIDDARNMAKLLPHFLN